MLAGVRPQLQRLRERLEPIGVAPAEALALLILLAAAVSLTGVVWWSSQPGASQAVLAPPELDPSAPPTPTGGGTAVPDEGIAVASDDVVVHVAGAVAQPGVITLPAGARVGDAIQAVGGPTADAVVDHLNLARVLSDGEQIRVPGPGEELPPSEPVAQGSTADPSAPVDLNAATIEQLQSLPGIGPVMAQRIIEHRESIGGFAAVTQLLEVTGIGPARFADLEARVRV